MKNSPEVIRAMLRGGRSILCVDGQSIIVNGGKYTMDVLPQEVYGEYPFFKAACVHSILRTQIRTKNSIGRRMEPKLFGKELMKTCLAYFLSKGLHVVAIAGAWEMNPRNSDNYNQYVEARGKGLDMRQAALSTWTGRVAAELGYRHVIGRIDPYHEYVRFLFYQNPLVALVPQAFFETQDFDF